MNDKICYVIGAGEWYNTPINKREQDFLIAVDGGYDVVKRLNIIPDVVIGDFDSVSQVPDEENCIRLNPIKDETDMLYSIQYAKEKGYRNICIFGGTGGSRISHTISNIQTLQYFDDLHCFLFDKEEVLFLVKDVSVRFDKECGGYLSVFSLTDKSLGVEEKGLKYEITDAELTSSFPIGVSNEFLGKESCVSVKKGTLLLVMEHKNLPYLRFEEAVYNYDG